MDEEIAEYIVRELGRHHKESDLIFTLAWRENLNWGEAKRLVEEVKLAQATRIARRQSPLLVVVGIATMIGGVVLAVSGGMFVFAYLRTLYQAWGRLDVDLLFPALLISAPQLVYQALACLVIGLAIIAGAAWGLGRLIVDATGC